MKQSLALFALLMVSTAYADNPPECQPVVDACTKAGFKLGAAKDGIGLFSHCLGPVLWGKPQPKNAKKKPPKVSKALVEKCTKAAPTFAK